MKTFAEMLNKNLQITYHSRVDAIEMGPVHESDYVFWQVSIRRFNGDYFNLNKEELTWLTERLKKTASKEQKLQGAYRFDYTGSDREYSSLVLTQYHTYDGVMLCFQRLDHQFVSLDTVEKSFHIDKKSIDAIITKIATLT